jgi:hypothetical protein
MSRVTLGASLLVAIVCLSLPNILKAQNDGARGGEGGAGGYGGAAGQAGEGGRGGEGGYGGETGERGGYGRGGYGGEYGGRGGYGLAAAEGDDPFGGEAADQKNGAEPNQPVVEPIKSAAAHIEAALNEPLKTLLQYENQPLNEVITVLAEEYNIPIMFDTAALEEVAISPDTEVTIALRNISLRSALNLMLRQPGLEDLTYVVDEEVLLITTEEKANEAMTVEVYRVDDLTRGYQTPFEGKASPYSSLTEVITRCVAHHTWMVNGSGEGEIRLMQPGMLVVTNTRRVHEEVQELLEKLRSARVAIDEDYDSRGGGRRGGGGRF